MIKSFRGLLADQGMRTIRLGTNDGLTGYRIKKFKLMVNEFGGTSNEHIVQLFTYPQDAALAKVDFDNSELLGAAQISNNTNGPAYPPGFQVVFDHVTFNQDIYITHIDNSSSDPVNYYLELEQVKLDLGEATVATLKDMRGTQ